MTSEFWGDDTRQTFLVGLVAFARHIWPYFGADVVWTQSRLPGALQGLLIAAPLAVWRAPESPILLLNVLSFASLCCFAWYLTRRLPGLPRWFVWGTLLTTPWTINFSTHIINTSYILPGAVVFFLGFFEAMPALSAGILGPAVAWGAIGFGLLWMMQIHLSWVLLPAYAAAAWLAAVRKNARAAVRAIAYFVAGAFAPAVLLVPTFVRAGTGGTEQNVQWHARGPWTLVTILAQFLSFPSYELNRFIGESTAERLVFLTRYWWLAPPALFLLVLGIVQPVVLLLDARRSRPARPAWPAIRLTTAVTILWIYVTYFFSIKEPLAHAFYVTFPVAMLYAMSCWEGYAARSGLRRFAAAVLVINVVFLVGFAAVELPARSLYRQRGLAIEAITRPNDRLLGERRWADERHDPVEKPQQLPDAVRAASPEQDLTPTIISWSRQGFGVASVLDVTIANRGSAAAYVDIEFTTRYYDSQSNEIATGHGVLDDIIEPGTSRRWDHLVDGRANPRAARVTMEITGAEPVVPEETHDK